MLSRDLSESSRICLFNCWLRNDNTLYLMNDHYHFHRKRQDSVSWTEKENSKISRKHFDKHFLDIGT